MYPRLTLYIAGQFVGSEGRAGQDVVDPATNAVIGTLPHATREDLEQALRAAETAFGQWRKTPAFERSAVLRRGADLLRARADEIASNITSDEGKPLVESMAEVRSSAEHLEWHAEESRRIYGRLIPSRSSEVRQRVQREPIGVCAALTPWNFPLSQAVRKVAAALGAGCTVVLKGPEDAPSATVALAHVLHDAGLPDGCFNAVWGNPRDVATTLIASPITRKVTFTGSVAVGKELAALAGSHMKRCTMELGGHAPVIVCDDADVESAADALATYKFRNAGQVCVSPTRFLVQERSYERFLARFLARVEAINVGPGAAPTTTMGPLAHTRRIAAVGSMVEDATSRGARLVAGGETIAGSGNFFAPTVLVDIPEDASIMTQEPFGPVAGVVRFATLEEAIERANRLSYGLAAYAFTSSIRRAGMLADALECGMVAINHTGLALPETPFGGVKDSGYGSEGGNETFEGYLTTKFVTQRE